MSYTIEYNKKVYSTEEKGNKKYILLVRQGDNNVYEDNNTRAKDCMTRIKRLLS